LDETGVPRHVTLISVNSGTENPITVKSDQPLSYAIQKALQLSNEVDIHAQMGEEILACQLSFGEQSIEDGARIDVQYRPSDAAVVRAIKLEDFPLLFELVRQGGHLPLLDGMSTVSYGLYRYIRDAKGASLTELPALEEQCLSLQALEEQCTGSVSRSLSVMYAKPDRCQTSSNWGETTTNAGGKTTKANGKAKAKSQSTAELFDAVHQRLGLTTAKDPLLRPFALGAATRTPSRRSMRSGAAPEL